MDKEQTYSLLIAKMILKIRLTLIYLIKIFINCR